MNQRTLSALVLLNAVLLAAITMVGWNPDPVQAQAGGERQYLMISGEVQARGPQDAVYIVDLRSSEMVVARFDSRTGELMFLDGRRILDDMRMVDR